MMPLWKPVHSGQKSDPKWKQPGYQMTFPKSILPPDRWNREGQLRAAYAAVSSCRSLHSGFCRLGEPHHPSVGRFAFLTTHEEKSPLRPKIVTVVQPGGGRLVKKLTILLNRRAVQNFEQLVADISEAMGLPRWKNDRIRRLFGLWGREIRSVSDFFCNDDIFVAAARDRPSVVEVQEVLEELFPGDACFHGAVLQAWKKLLWPLVKASKGDSGFQEKPDPYQGLPAGVLGNSTQRTRDRAEQNGQDVPDRVWKWEQVRLEGQRNEQPRVRKMNKAEKPGGCDEEPRTGCCKECRRVGPRRAMLAPIEGRRGAQPAAGLGAVENHICPEGRKNPHGEREEQPKDGKGGRGKDHPRLRERAGGSLLPKQMKNEGKKMSRETGDGVGDPAKSLDSPEGQGGSEAENPIQDGQTVRLVTKETCEQSAEKPGVELTQPLQGMKDTPEKDKGVGDNKTEMWPEARLQDSLPSRTVLTEGEIERYYEIGRIIGDGNFATVRECWVRAVGIAASPFAMKIIDRAKLRGKEHMLQNEVSITQGLSHPNVVRLLRHYETTAQIFLLMELVHGGDLFDAITEKGKFSEECTAQMLWDLCQALDYIHDKSIVHRDLKPENLLVQRNADGSTTLKLADFGLAMVVTEPIFTVCGTPTYVAPEILGEKGYGLPVDMWATGVIVYILLCGFPPFRSQEKDQEELFQLIQQGVYEFLSPYWDGISQGAKDFTSDLLLVDSQRRMTASKTLQHPWLQGRGQLGCHGYQSTEESI